jgi:hypothetical protein
VKREQTMDAERFRTLALSYGGTLARWPAAERQAAEAFLSQSADARRLIDEQRRLDERLDLLVADEPSPDLLRSVAEIPLRHRSDAGLLPWWPFVRLRHAVAIAAAAAAIGVAAGAIAPERPGAASTDGWDELSGLAFARDLSEELSP